MTFKQLIDAQIKTIQDAQRAYDSARDEDKPLLKVMLNSEKDILTKFVSITLNKALKENKEKAFIDKLSSKDKELVNTMYYRSYRMTISNLIKEGGKYPLNRDLSSTQDKYDSNLSFAENYNNLIDPLKEKYPNLVIDFAQNLISPINSIGDRELSSKLDEIIGTLEETVTVTDEDAQLAFDDATKYKNPILLPIEQNIIGFNDDIVDEMLQDKTNSKELNDSLNYIKSDIKSVNPKYTAAMVSYMQDTQKLLDTYRTKLEDKFTSSPGNEKYKKVYVYNYNAIQTINEGKEDVAEELRKAEPKISDKTRAAIKTIIQKLDSLDMINETNINVYEEPDKDYGFLKMANAKRALNVALHKKEKDKIPGLVKNYKEMYKTYSEIIKIAKENFNTDDRFYGANLDEARNANLPIEFTKELQATAQINGLFLALKACKRFNVSIEDYINTPHKLISEIAHKAKVEQNFEPKGNDLAEKIIDLDTRAVDPTDLGPILAWGFACRMADGIPSLDPENKEYNALIDNTMCNELDSVKAIASMKIGFFPHQIDYTNTFENLFIVDEKTFNENLLALSDGNDMRYDYVNNKSVPKFNKEEYLQSFTESADSIYERISTAHSKLLKFYDDDAKVSWQNKLKDKEKMVALNNGALRAIDKILAAPNTFESQDYIKLKNLQVSLKENTLKYFNDPVNASKKFLTEQLGEDFFNERVTNAITSLTNDSIEDKDQYENRYQALMNACAKRFIYSHTADFNNSDFKKVTDTMNDYLEQLNLKTRVEKSFGNDKSIDIAEPYKFAITDHKKQNIRIAYSIERLPSTYKGLMTRSIEQKLSNVEGNKIDLRGEDCKNRVRTLLNKNEEVSDDTIKKCGGILSHLEEKKNSRSSLWILFNFRKYGREKQYIEDIKQMLRDKNITDETIQDAKVNSTNDIGYKEVFLNQVDPKTYPLEKEENIKIDIRPEKNTEELRKSLGAEVKEKEKDIQVNNEKEQEVKKPPIIEDKKLDV